MIPGIRAILADDELSAREKLRRLLTQEAGVHIVADCRNGGQTIAAVQAYKPDLLFLGTQLPDADGFQVLNRVPPEDMPIVILTSTHEQHALRAFEARALDYLLKPFDQLRLHMAIERVRAELIKTQQRHLTNRILNLLTEARPTSHADRRLVVKAGSRMLFLDMDEIDWIEAAGNYVDLKAGAVSYRMREGIGRILERLDPAQFVRIHRSLIVNIRRIKELQPCNSGEYMVILKDGKELSCSRTYRANLQRIIAAH